MISYRELQLSPQFTLKVRQALNYRGVRRRLFEFAESLASLRWLPPPVRARSSPHNQQSLFPSTYSDKDCVCPVTLYTIK